MMSTCIMLAQGHPVPQENPVPQETLNTQNNDMSMLYK